MLNVGLTGNVASGKSTVARHFQRAGATLLDADQLVRDVQRPGSPVLAAIVDRFGREILRGDGSLDRDRLRARILADSDARAQLEALVHPAVQERRTLLVADARARGDLIVVNDIPLLFEVLDPDAFDLVLLVHAAEAVRRDRLVRLRGMPPGEADRLIASQLPSEAKRGRAHVVIENDGDLAALERVAAETWSRIRRDAATRATASGGALLVVVAHPDDALVLLRGTLARYADAGTTVTLVCAAGRLGAGLPTRIEIAEFEREPGGLDPEDRTAISALTDLVRRQAPDAVITVGPGAAEGERDHHAVSRWATAAIRTVGLACPVYHPLPHDPRYAIDRSGVSAVLDVRPWRGGEGNAAAPCGLQYDPGAVPAPWNGREWYAGGTPSAATRTDLLTPESAG